MVSQRDQSPRFAIRMDAGSTVLSSGSREYCLRGQFGGRLPATVPGSRDISPPGTFACSLIGILSFTVISLEDDTSSAIRLRRGPRSQYSLWKEAGARGANARDDALGDAEVTTHRCYVVDWIDAGGDDLRGRAIVSTLRREYERLHLVATMPARRHPLRSYIVALFKRGELVSVREAELICDASRQAITKWLRREHIDIGVRRLERIGRLRAKAMTDLDDMPVKRLSKAELRKQTEKAVSAFNRRNRAQ